MQGQAPASVITGIPGWETEGEQRLLLELAQAVPEKGTIVEIGAEFGMSTSLFAKGAHESVSIVSVDLFPEDLLGKHRSNLAEAGFADRSRQIAAPSVETAADWGPKKKPLPIDLLFIDGDHTYEGVKADIEGWVKFVPVGGVVVFHDCACLTNAMPHYLHFEVTRALSAWYLANGAGWQQTHMVDTMIAFRRIDNETTEPPAT